MKKFIFLLFFIFASSAMAMDKKTTFDIDSFNQAQSEGKVVVVSSWIKYCTSCASQMKALNILKDDFQNLEYYTFEVTNKEIA